jgi:hypothetical protein
MNPRDHDPADSLGYLNLVKAVVRVFRQVTSPSDLVEALGKTCFTDITEVAEIRLMEIAQPLPPSYLERVYQFRDPALGRGIMDAAFHDGELVNMRAQLFFNGLFARSKARKYLREVLVPLFQGILGSPSEQAPDTCIFHSLGLIGVVRYVPGTPSISVALTDDRFC